MGQDHFANRGSQAIQLGGPILAPPSYIYIIHSQFSCTVCTVHCVQHATDSACPTNTYLVRYCCNVLCTTNSDGVHDQYISGPVLPALKLPPVSHLCLHPICNEHSHQREMLGPTISDQYTTSDMVRYKGYMSPTLHPTYNKHYHQREKQTRD